MFPTQSEAIQETTDMYRVLEEMNVLTLYGAATTSSMKESDSRRLPVAGSYTVPPNVLEEIVRLPMKALTPKPSNSILWAGCCFRRSRSTDFLHDGDQYGRTIRPRDVRPVSDHSEHGRHCAGSSAGSCAPRVVPESTWTTAWGGWCCIVDYRTLLVFRTYHSNHPVNVRNVKISACGKMMRNDIKKKRFGMIASCMKENLRMCLDSDIGRNNGTSQLL
jgi:hypothetical protein